VTLRYYPPRRPAREWRGTTGGSTRAWRVQRTRILQRDGYQCTHVDPYTGERCPVHTPARLEIHHLDAGIGLEAPDDRLATRCPSHNPRGTK
jgi:hypothetical protein